MRASIAIATVSAVLSFAVLASAQPKTSKSEKIETYEFPDDKLLSPLSGGGALIISGPPKTVRVLLTRPRTQFIPELLKTIEGL